MLLMRAGWWQSRDGRRVVRVSNKPRLLYPWWDGVDGAWTDLGRHDLASPDHPLDLVLFLGDGPYPVWPDQPQQPDAAERRHLTAIIMASLICANGPMSPRVQRDQAAKYVDEIMGGSMPDALAEFVGSCIAHDKPDADAPGLDVAQTGGAK